MKSFKWTIDSSKSEIVFKVRKLKITNIKGNFNVFDGEMETDSEQPQLFKNIKFKAPIDSIQTDDKKRDEHLKSADFFDMQNYPYLYFTAKSLHAKAQKSMVN